MKSFWKQFVAKRPTWLHLTEEFGLLEGFVGGAAFAVVGCLLFAGSVALGPLWDRWRGNVSESNGTWSATVPRFPIDSLPARLHVDGSDDTNSKLTFGDVPLSYTELFAHPDSEYAQMIQGLSLLAVESGGDFVVNFRPAEVAGANVDMLMGAVCITEQNMDALYPYHTAVLAGTEASTVSMIRRLVTTDARIDIARFDDCFRSEVWRNGVVKDFDPTSLIVTQAVDGTWADGKPFRRALSLCNEGSGVKHVAGVVPCARELLVLAKRYGSLFSYAEGHISVAPSLLEAPLVLPQSLEYGFDNEDKTYRVTAMDADGVATLVATLGTELGQRAALWVDGPTLYVAHPSTGWVTGVSLFDGHTFSGELPSGVDMRPGEHIWFIRAIDGGFGTLLCSDAEYPDACRFVFSDSANGRSFGAAFPLTLHLYEGLRFTGWDLPRKVATFVTNGGDGPWRDSSEFTLNLVTGEKRTVYEFNGALNCLGVEIGEYGCDTAAIDAANGWVQWVDKQRQLLPLISGCPWLFGVDDLTAGYIGCALEIRDGHMEEPG